MGIKKFFLAFTLFLFALFASAQEGYTLHTVQEGETIYRIARQYNVSEGDLARYNPDIAKGIKPGDVILIPKKSNAATNNSYIEHTVAPKETLYSLSKQYDCTIEQIESLNPQVKDGLKAGMILRIPVKKQTAANLAEDNSRFNYHTVEPRETVYSICKMAGITEDEFLQLNPEVKETGLQIGMRVKYPKEKNKTQVREEIASDTPGQMNKSDLYRIQAGDDVGSIARKHGMSTQELIELNPELNAEVKPGRYVVVKPKTTLLPEFKSTGNTKPLFWNLPHSGQSPKLRLALLIPLYIVESDTSSKVNDKAKMGLQFLSGFKIAMDTLAKLGYDITLDIYDTKNSKEEVERISKSLASDVDAIIGPLYARNAEHLANLRPEMLIISPLSKTVNNATTPNLVNCIPDLESELTAIAAKINSYKGACQVVFCSLDTAENRKNVKFIQGLITNPTASQSDVWIKKGSGTQALDSKLTHTGQRTFVVLVDQNIPFLSQVMNKFRFLNDTNKMLLGTEQLLELQTIETKYYDRINFVAFGSDYVDYSDTATQVFILQFRKMTGTDPVKFGFHGYDTGLYFAQTLTAAKAGNNNWPVVKGISKGFHFNQPNGAGAVNRFVYPLQIRELELKVRN